TSRYSTEAAREAVTAVLGTPSPGTGGMLATKGSVPRAISTKEKDEALGAVAPRRPRAPRAALPRRRGRTASRHSDAPPRRPPPRPGRAGRDGRTPSRGTRRRRRSRARRGGSPLLRSGPDIRFRPTARVR